MKITFLGTGTSVGVPMIGCQCEVCSSSDPKDKRLRSSILIEVKGKNIVVDTGPDFRQQMLQHNIKKLDAVLFTHEHKDHTAGLDDIRPFNFFLKREIPIYGEERVLEALRQEFSYVFAEDAYPGIPKMELHAITNKSFKFKQIKIRPVRVLHHKLPILGFRIGSFAYITDAKSIPVNEKHKIKRIKYLVINALRFKPHLSHFNVEEALDLIDELKPENVYFTHMSHNFGLHEETQKILPKNVTVAFDGMQLNIDNG